MLKFFVRDMLDFQHIKANKMIKDIFEDIQRHKSDNQENRRKVLVGDPKTSKFIPKPLA